MQSYYLAIDIGASSGRHILGHVEDGKLVLKEIHRFDNKQIHQNGHDCWDMDNLWTGIVDGLKACKALGKIPATVGIDTWAVDYVLLDGDGRQIGDAVAYRDGRTEGMDKVVEGIVPPTDKACAEQSILCVLLHMPFNLAVLDANAADAVIGDYPEITDWYIGGHSLGGAMAASYAAGHSDELRGLILLAAYPTKDLDNSGLKVLSVYGSEDGVLNMDSYTAAKDYFPDDTAEYLIEGGNHAYFRSYGDQKGDGTAGIGNAEQISQTAALVSEFMIAG